VLSWYLVHAKPQGEAKAQANLGRQGYEVYFPRVRELARHSGRWRERIGPLFPRYLFVRLDEGRDDFGPIHSTLGVAALVRFGSNYTIVAESVIRELRNRADPESGLHRLTPRASFAAGSRVRLLSGPLEGLEGVFQCETGSDRVTVLLDILGRQTAVRVPAEFVCIGLPRGICDARG
jgi:transcriptional antiterminator RfaH